ARPERSDDDSANEKDGDCECNSEKDRATDARASNGETVRANASDKHSANGGNESNNVKSASGGNNDNGSSNDKYSDKDRYSGSDRASDSYSGSANETHPGKELPDDQTTRCRRGRNCEENAHEPPSPAWHIGRQLQGGLGWTNMAGNGPDG